MERRGNLLGYVAIGLGALALIVALAGLGGPQVSIQVPWAGVSPAEVPAAPAAPQAPAPPLEPARPEGKRLFRHELEREWRFHGRAPWGEHGWGHGPGLFAGRHGPGWFMGPFMFLGDLIKLGLALLAAILGLRLLRGRGGPGGAAGTTGQNPGTPPQDPPPPPPHTGPTAYL